MSRRFGLAQQESARGRRERSHDHPLRVPGKLLQQVGLEVLVGDLRDQELQQEVQEAEDQMSERTQSRR